MGGFTFGVCAYIFSKAASECNRCLSPLFSHLNIIREKPMVLPEIRGHMTERRSGEDRKEKGKGGRMAEERGLSMYIQRTVA